MRGFVQAAVAATAALASSGTANAAAVFVANADFEAGPPLADGQYVSVFNQSTPNWNRGLVAAYGRWNPSAQHFTNEAAVGTVGRSDGGSVQGAANLGSLGQNLAGVTLQANTRYTMLVDVGNPLGAGNFEYVLGFVAGGVLPSEGGIVIAELIGANDMFGTRIADGQLGTVRISFETGSQSALFGRQLGVTLGGYGNFGTTVAFDNVRVDVTRLTAAVPEPSTWAMMIGGFGLVGGALRRRATSRPALV